MKLHGTCMTAGWTIGLLLVAPSVWAENSLPSQGGIGMFTAVEGQVTVIHSGTEKAMPVKLRDDVHFKDVIETKKESRSKALLNDDSILTVGENSTVEITEHIYDPTANTRSVVVNLVKGSVRALVGKVFAGSGSKFEVHTPTAVAAARGTYFVVAFDNSTWIMNIGHHGDVAVTSGSQTVTLPPGFYTNVPVGGGLPSMPTPMTGGTGSNLPPEVAAAVKSTNAQESQQLESPQQVAMLTGGNPIQPPAGPPPPPNVFIQEIVDQGGGQGGGGEGDSGGQSGGGDGAPSGPSGPTGPTGPIVISPPFVTIPGVTQLLFPDPPDPPDAPEPPGPPGPRPDRFAKWFATLVERLAAQFDQRVDRIDEKEDQAIKRIESKYDEAVKNAELEEARRIQQALDKEKKQIEAAEKRYQDALDRIEKEHKKNQEEKKEKVAKILAAQLQRAADARTAHNQRIMAWQDAREEMLRRIEKARIARVEGWELLKTFKVSYRYVDNIKKYGERYITRLEKNKADEARLNAAKTQIDEAIKNARTQVRLASVNAIQDDIARGIRARFGPHKFEWNRYPPNRNVENKIRNHDHKAQFRNMPGRSFEVMRRIQERQQLGNLKK